MGHQRAPSIRNSHGSTSIRPPAPTSRLPEAKLNQVMDAFVGILVAEYMLNSTRGLRLIRHLFPHSISLLIKLGKRSRRSFTQILRSRSWTSLLVIFSID